VSPTRRQRVFAPRKHIPRPEWLGDHRKIDQAISEEYDRLDKQLEPHPRAAELRQDRLRVGARLRLRRMVEGLRASMREHHLLLDDAFVVELLGSRKLWDEAITQSIMER